MSIKAHHEQASLFSDDTSTRRHPRHVLSYGLGLDSTAVLLRWLTDPSSRDFDLSDLKFACSGLPKRVGCSGLAH